MEERELLDKAKNLLEQFKKKNTYQFKENLVEYFVLAPSNDLAIDSFERLKGYHFFLVEKSKDFFDQLQTIDDPHFYLRDLINKMEHFISVLANKEIEQFKDEENCFEAYFKQVLLKLFKELLEYNEVLKTHLEHHRICALKAVSYLVNYLNQLGIESMSATINEEYIDHLLEMFDPETIVSNNKTNDPNLLGRVKELVEYAYFMKNQDRIYLIKKGKLIIWME